MKKTLTKIQGLFIIEPALFGDNRGWFMESYNKGKFAENGIETVFCQDNHSYSSKKGIIRGIHFQNEPYAQTKLVRCTRGSVLDVAVDLRKSSPTYKKWVAVELNAENKKQFYIPKGFGHAFLALSDDVEVEYKVDAYYSKTHDRSIRYDDPDIGISWPSMDYIFSEKDLKAPFLKDSDVNFQ